MSHRWLVLYTKFIYKMALWCVGPLRQRQEIFWVQNERQNISSEKLVLSFFILGEIVTKCEVGPCWTVCCVLLGPFQVQSGEYMVKHAEVKTVNHHFQWFTDKYEQKPAQNVWMTVLFLLVGMRHYILDTWAEDFEWFSLTMCFISISVELYTSSAWDSQLSLYEENIWMHLNSSSAQETCAGWIHVYVL